MKAVVIFSGGQDSTTCLLRSLKENDETVALTFNYGQKNSVEIECAKNICSHLSVKHEVIDVSEVFRKVECTPYLHKDGVLGGKSGIDLSLPATWVPNRNMLFITLAHCYALKISFDKVITGVNAVDYSGYPDCRPAFISALQHAIAESVPAGAVKIETPLIRMTKADIWKEAYDLGGINIIKEFTHTCYNGDHTTRHEWGYGCGECDSCKIRKDSYEEFLRNAVRDPSV